ncbi:MAG: prolyl oligopeptidase family serine peptidase [Candidatus Dadabacteria bacterium]|nr:prolyl oligopeptidase family serine peptidase [Candidatus Dadabacteria bacterium]
MSETVEQYEGWWATKPVRVKEGILFSYYSPSAKEISLAGDFNGWKKRFTPLVKGKDDVWRIVLELRPDRSYDYKYIVDGSWVNDPNNVDLNPDVAGGANSVIYLGITGEILNPGDPERHKFTLEGRHIYTGSYFSTNYKQRFEYYFISPRYEEGEKLPIIICLNNYIKSQELHIYARKNIYLAIIPSVTLGGQYIRQGKLNVFPELLDQIKHSFPVDEDRVYVTGMSYGGLEALLVSLYYPDLIAASAVVFGPYRLRSYKDKIEKMNKEELKEFINSLDYPHRMLNNLKDFPLYISHGGGDEAIPLDEGAILHKILKELGAPTEIKYYPKHGHTWYMVDEDLPRVFDWFKRFKRNKYPKSFNYTAPNGFFKSSIFWLDFSPSVIEQPVEIEANINDNNGIELAFKNIKRIRIRLNSELLKLPGMVYIDTGTWTQEMDIDEKEKEIELMF